jgi:hypothetical protein
MTNLSVLVGTCPFCGSPSTIAVSSPEEAAAVLDWIENRFHRPHVQTAFPHFTPDQRESMISGSHQACFDAAFPPEGH